MPLDVVGLQGNTRVTGLSNDEQCSIALLQEVVAYLKDENHRAVHPHQRKQVDNLARDLNIFLEIFVKTRERLRELEPPENKVARSNSKNSVEPLEEIVTKNGFGPPSYPPPEIPLPTVLSSFSLSILDVLDGQCLPIFSPQEERTAVKIAKENTSMESLIIKPASPISRSTSSSTVSSILEITHQDSNGEYHRVDYDSSKNSSSLSLFGKAKAMLNNTVKKQSSDQLAKEGGNDKKQAKPTEGPGSVPGRKHLRRVQRKISRADKLGSTE